MRTELRRHPESRSGEGVRVEAEVVRSSGGELSLTYRVLGDTAALQVPPPEAPARADELWRHTCFELFVTDGEGGYLEFNFAPSTRWAAYRFSGYREGMVPAEVAAPPRIATSSGGGLVEVRVTLTLPDELSRIGLSAVLEERDGGISYWAAAHPAGKPDFHHPDSFALELPATDPR